MYLADKVARLVAFLRAGYPTGMPSTGYVTLAALSRRRLSDDEITAITSELMIGGRAPVSTSDVGVHITRVTDDMPSPDDVELIQRRLEAIGYVRGQLKRRGRPAAGRQIVGVVPRFQKVSARLQSA